MLEHAARSGIAAACLAAAAPHAALADDTRALLDEVAVDAPLAPRSSASSEQRIHPEAIKDAPQERSHARIRSLPDVAVGVALTLLGVAQVVPGVILISQPSQGFIDFNPAIGAILAGVGVGHLVPGIVLIAVGASPYREKQDATSLTFTPGPGGANMTLRF